MNGRPEDKQRTAEIERAKAAQSPEPLGCIPPPPTQELAAEWRGPRAPTTRNPVGESVLPPQKRNRLAAWLFPTVTYEWCVVKHCDNYMADIHLAAVNLKHNNGKPADFRGGFVVSSHGQDEQAARRHCEQLTAAPDQPSAQPLMHATLSTSYDHRDSDTLGTNMTWSDPPKDPRLVTFP